MPIYFLLEIYCILSRAALERARGSARAGRRYKDTRVVGIYLFTPPYPSSCIGGFCALIKILTCQTRGAAGKRISAGDNGKPEEDVTTKWQDIIQLNSFTCMNYIIKMPLTKKGDPSVKNANWTAATWPHTHICTYIHTRICATSEKYE